MNVWIASSLHFRMEFESNLSPRKKMASKSTNNDG